jgi:RimJ/RimL family protein N-acetyltransferase
VIFRPAAGSELERVTPLLAADPAAGLTPDQFRDRAGRREYRPEWTWLAEDGPDGTLLGFGCWWGRPAESAPAALDGVFVAESAGSPADRTRVAAGLLTAAHRSYAQAGTARPPDFHILLPADWRDQPAAVAALSWRQDAAREAGLPQRLERISYEWTPSAGLPDPRGRRLRFRAEPDDEVFVELFRRVLAGTLDATSQAGTEALGAEAQARRDVAFYRDQMAGDRAWWRVAETPSGGVAGFGLPSRNTEFPVVGYLGVLPEHRGDGYSGEILAEITRILAAEAGATAIRADTDLANRPMAAALTQAGYRTTGCRLVLSAAGSPA